MTEWVAVGGGCIVGDVIRWKEWEFERRGPRSGRAGKKVLVGERVVTAEVLKKVDRDGWVRLNPISCVVGVSRIHRRVVTAVKAGTETRRAYSTLERAKAERMLWSDENNRAMLASKFLGNEEHERFMVMETDEAEAKPARSKQKTGRKPRARKSPRPRAD
jgi:hypothetical protein